MAQYKAGTASFVLNSNKVYGQSTKWLSNANVGDTIKKEGENAAYTIASIDADTELTLQVNYAGSGESNKNYQITRDFTQNLELPEISAGDKDWPFHVTQAFRIIDQYLADLLPYPETIDNIHIDDPRVVDGAVAPDPTQIISGTSVKMNVRKFAGDANQDVIVTWGVPRHQGVTSQLRYRVHGVITEATGPNAETISFAMGVTALNDSNAMNSAGFSGEFKSNKPTITRNQHTMFTTDWSNYFSVANIVSGETCAFKIQRLATSDDTYAQKIGVHSIDIEWEKL